MLLQETTKKVKTLMVNVDVTPPKLTKEQQEAVNYLKELKQRLEARLRYLEKEAGRSIEAWWNNGKFWVVFEYNNLSFHYQDPETESYCVLQDCDVDVIVEAYKAIKEAVASGELDKMLAKTVGFVDKL